MLVLTRTLQQQIKIGDEITVTILRVKGSTVRIGVQAPRNVRVIRGELPKSDGGDDQPTQPTPDSPLIVNVELTPQGIEVDAAPSPAPSPTAELPKPAHLPLKKVRNRRGNAPLKQMVAACALAK
jgi:carbon storage regulator CsrA